MDGGAYMSEAWFHSDRWADKWQDMAAGEGLGQVYLFLCLVRGSDYRHTALWSWEFHKSFWNVFHLEYVGIELGISFFSPPEILFVYLFNYFWLC